jgi:beta-glucosidase
MTFPPGFLFGVATAAIQIEGASDERGSSIWDAFAREPGRVANGDTPDVACDHYHRWEDDLDLMGALGVDAYRFSISWPRVLPTGSGPPNRAGIDFYKRVVDGLHARSIEPLATLYHWDLPQALQDAGGWPARDTAARFAEYASLMFEELGDGVARWITHNEPWVTAFLGHAYGSKAPGRRDWREALRVAHHVLLSHGLAVREFRAAGRGGGSIGITLDFAPAYPLSTSAADREAAERWDAFRNRWFLDPVMRGRYPPDLLGWFESRLGGVDLGPADDLAVAAEPIDFVGVNYYSRAVVGDNPNDGPLGVRQAPATLPTTGMGWEIAPDALRDLLVRIKREYGDIPILITENGSAYDDPAPSDGVVADPERLAYLRDHLGAVARAAADGVNVHGYFAWSLLDNFEWEHGYGKRFGIVYVDYATQRRVPKTSALWYRDLIADRGPAPYPERAAEPRREA